MKLFFLGLIIFFAVLLPCWRGPLLLASDYAKRVVGLYDSVLTDQEAIEKINELRAPIYLYTDFGGGNDRSVLCNDRQTKGEIASAGWKGSLQTSLYINDGAEPLKPLEAAYRLARTFPYNPLARPYVQEGELKFHTVVIHVIDPGVGNDQGRNKQPRALVLRKDGVLFIGPDNGTLSFVCPEESLGAVYEIDAKKVTSLSGIDVEAGGTFHGRDLFSEAAFRLVSGQVSIEEIGKPYPSLKTCNRFPKDEVKLRSASSIAFEKVRLDRFESKSPEEDEEALFSEAFFLGVIQSPLYKEKGESLLTSSKKFFILRPSKPGEELIGLFNKRTGNIYLGPNNGLATSFFSGWGQNDYEVYAVSQKDFDRIRDEANCEIAADLLRQLPLFTKELVALSFLGEAGNVERDFKGRPKKAEGRIWIDLYGNMKTTVPGTVLKEVRTLQGRGRVIINGIEKPILFADSFSEVPENALFAYCGSSARIGPNPRRSIRYVELTANGIFGKFGVDFFSDEGVKPKSGQKAIFLFDYE